MKRKRLDESTHPLDPYPFEAYWWGSWQAVERLRIKDGAITMHVVDNGEVMEEMIPMSNLRMRSRKATINDCSCILRPGLDVCVLTASSDTEDSDEDSPVWADARIRSIERKPHDAICTCHFYVSFYVREGTALTLQKKLSKETTMVQIGQIMILQKLESIPSENQHYRWSTSEDCSSLLKYKLFTGKFCSDLTWLVVASAIKQTTFDVRSVENQLVYEVLGIDGGTNVSGCESYSVNFKLDNGILSPIILKYFPGVGKRTGEKTHTNAPLCPCEPMDLRRSKRRFVQPDRYLGCDVPEFDVETPRIGGRKMCKWEYDDDECEEMPLALSIQADHKYQKHDENENRDFSFERRSDKIIRVCGSGNKSTVSRKSESLPAREKKQSDQSQLALVPLSISSEGKSILRELDASYGENPEDHSGNIADLISKYLYENGSTAKGRKKKTSELNFTRKEHGFMVQRLPRKTYKRNAFCVRSEWESIYNMKPSGKKSFSAAACRELLTRCMENIDATINMEQPPIIDQWKEFKSTKFENQKETNDKAEENHEEEISEIDMLWKEMELALASCYFLDDGEDSHAFPTEGKLSTEKGGKGCHHDYRLNEEIGIICRLCGFVSTEIKDVSPPFLSTAGGFIHKEQRAEENSEHKPNGAEGLDNFQVPASSKAPSSEGEVEDNVWALIPDLRSKLRDHQKRAFEFLWRNIAGSLVPGLMEEMSKRRGGCVISHTPGAGKTLLIITFLVSYLKLFPGSRPLVLAPKTTLYTWYKEVIKWNIPIPVYQIHGGQTYKGEVLRQRLRSNAGLPRNQDFMHVLDCLEKMQKWLSHPSVLLMGYTSFLTLTREGSNYAHRKYMAQVLRQCPGILILDEGHNPRSTKSRLRKALMKVNTKLRVLLSGTLFQNNFGEYFNTLCLARPNFVKEVLKELDPRYKRNKKGPKNRFSQENRARKMFIDKISKLIDSNIPEERLEGLNILKNLTGGFIDVYEGGSTDNLPGLQCYTLMMKSTSLQQGILDKLQDQRPVYKGFPLELELLITLGAIHPWLIRTTACSNQYFSAEELEDLERTKFDVKFGSKVRFVMSLIPKCVFRREKVLIFCHNIAPINLFLELFATIFHWRKGKEVLVLQGDIELFERGRVMDKFEEPGGPSKVMLASITACAEGISLTAASRVILLDSEWNPSKSKQAIARAFRPGQDKVVYVYQLLAGGTLEEEKYSRTTWKEWVSSMIFSEELVEDPSHWQAQKIEDELLREIVEEDRATLFHRIMKIEKASSVIREGEGRSVKGELGA